MSFWHVLLFNMLCFSVNCQVSVITSSGNAQNQYGSLSYSLGEVFYTTKGFNYTQAEGIQHNYLINPLNTVSKLRIISYPNPTSDSIYFLVENLNYLDLYYILYDLFGKVISTGNIKNNTFISMKDLPAQNYILRCFRGSYEENSFKITKIE